MDVDEEGFVYEDSLLPQWLLQHLTNPDYDSEIEGSRPLRYKWPKETTLGRDHFTIDTQQCVDCGKDLKWMMPMNKKPNGRYLFCHNEEGAQICGKNHYLRCHYCGNINNENSGAIVFRTGNSAFDGPSQIYQFMCYHCHKEQMETEPGLKECREKMTEIREVRRQDEMNYRQNGLSGSALLRSSKDFNERSGKKRKMSEKDEE